MNYLGDFSVDQIVYLYFNTFDSNDPSASVTMTNFINTDVHIHKNDSLTQRNNAAGITVDVDVDAITGSHFIKIDTSDNTVAGFFAAANDYFVRIEGVTVDGATINPVVGSFSIENRATIVKIAAVKAETSLIVADTNELQTDNVPGLISTLDAVVDTVKVDTAATLVDTAELGSAVGASISADIAAVKAETVLIVADTNELQTDDIPGKLVTLDAVVDTVKAETVLILADTADMQPKLGTPAGLDMSADIAAVKAETVLIVADTNELQTDDIPGKIVTLDAVVDTVKAETVLILADTATLGAPVGASHSADTAAVKAETALIVADTNELQTDDIPGKIATLDAVVDTVKAETVLILADTADIQPKIGTPAANVSADIAAVKVDTAATLVDTAEIGTAGAGLGDLGGMSTAMKAEVNAEAKDVLNTDTISMPGQGALTATPTPFEALAYLYKNARNKKTATATLFALYDDAGSTVDQKAVLSDDGTTATKGEIISGL